ncbi:uncharacterized protein LOC107693972 [Sinocyclocheilus anshuiensis]|uniref:uncharacterized protein LOC107693972 n=1 Tax=Sinocyclocheilus anshuiensis TaxID=1608454 RepID=UPI0007B7F1AF|nr:PREDICTED: uncharacterized protein LOC107693972 [Sinocyclocheilus anshuiensis]
MMHGCFIHIWLFFFAVFVREIKVKEVKTGLYNRVELTGEELDQNIADSLKSVEWTKRKGSITCLCITKTNIFNASYSQCCGTAHFYLNNNTLILERVTARDEGVFIETIVTGNGTTKCLNFTLIIQYPPNATEIVVSWTSSTSVALKCEVSGLFLHLMWKREGVPILEKHRHSFSERNQTLHISNITSSEYGTYSCIASNAYGESEKHTYITSGNSTVNQGNGTRDKTQFDQTVLSSGLTLTGVLGLCIVFYCLYKYHHRQRAENGRTTDEGGAANDLGIYQEVPDPEEVTPLPYVYTDFIKPKESSRASAAAQHFEDFGYSEVGPTCRERVSNEESTACPEAGEE